LSPLGTALQCATESKSLAVVTGRLPVAIVSATVVYAIVSAAAIVSSQALTQRKGVVTTATAG